MAEIGDDERHVIRVAVWSGFTGPDEADDLIADLLLDEPELDEDALHAFAAAEFARKAADEASWPATTDCDRLDVAFAALADAGILALHNAGFTVADGHVEAAEALARVPKDRFLGYCFYHAQDVERAVEGAPLWIAFDHIRGDVPEKAHVARLVVSALEAAGLAPCWDGDPGRRIVLERFDWKRRFAG
ncbi:hypothetical protein Q8W71_03020 [Methylobacterium sp. NEAU 140]|uniref:DUF6891 domain-containing protein n=1 Tax=Methylobacterium sp. NEAU 140 TaxID=3064945 RepID=UPI00273257EC|nr:hypothetical protein [Methylobacterium sp. NEAU 140]MDP4021583.1 hypothetical protein [Methylobacterium sp. NEAU 140]